MKIIKRIAKGFVALSAVLVAALLALMIYHNANLALAKRDLVPMGEMIDVNGHSMHVYEEGSGQPTLVFLSGNGTPAPALNFKPLYERLSDDYHIVVVERAGFGFSDTADSPRDIDNILAETRAALDGAGISGPYTLLPHSIAGLEAVYWATKYPEEVEAIIGLDAAVPQSYFIASQQALAENADKSRMMASILRMGIIRLIPGVIDDSDPALAYLDEQEQTMYRNLTMQNIMNDNMVEETAAVYQNAVVVDKLELPPIPVFYLISDGSGLPASWQQNTINFVGHFQIGQYEILDCGHYLHAEAPDAVADKIKGFMRDLVSME